MVPNSLHLHYPAKTKLGRTKAAYPQMQTQAQTHSYTNCKYAHGVVDEADMPLSELW